MILFIVGLNLSEPYKNICTIKLVPSSITNLPNIGDLLWGLYI